MAVLGINSRAASPFKKVDFAVAWVKMAKTRHARIDAENDHRRVTRPRLRIIVKETRGYPTDYLQAPSDTIKYDPESREVGCETSFFLSRLWIWPSIPSNFLNRNRNFLSPEEMLDHMW